MLLRVGKTLLVFLTEGASSTGCHNVAGHLASSMPEGANLNHLGKVYQSNLMGLLGMSSINVEAILFVGNKRTLLIFNPLQNLHNALGKVKHLYNCSNSLLTVHYTQATKPIPHKV